MIVDSIESIISRELFEKHFVRFKNDVRIFWSPFILAKFTRQLVTEMKRVRELLLVGRACVRVSKAGDTCMCIVWTTLSLCLKLSALRGYGWNTAWSRFNNIEFVDIKHYLNDAYDASAHNMSMPCHSHAFGSPLKFSLENDVSFISPFVGTRYMCAIQIDMKVL